VTALRERGRLLQAALLEERVRRSNRDVGVVLVYHRVAEVSGAHDLELAPAVGRSVFRAELAYLLRRYAVVPPTALPEATGARRPSEPVPVALTFDDDTRSHVEEVLPVLAALGAVAGFYVGGWSLHGDPRPWWETLQLAVDHGRLRPDDLPEAPGDVAAALRRDPGALRRLGREVEMLDPVARRSLARRLGSLTAGLPTDPGLRERELGELVGQHEVGFHTRAHDRLVALPDGELARALVHGRAELEAAIGRPVDAIAYPHGDADARVAAAARSAGYALGLDGRNRALTTANDRLLLPRLSPSHSTLGIFALTLARATLAA
jgi:peptidoglycan/xylan/chitin deacetylase (PgdA/CDA1 family)